MSNETVIASVTLKSRSGLSVFEHPRKLSIRNIADFRPVPRRIDQIVNLLIEAGFTIEAQTEVGVSFSGPKNLFEHEFKTTLQQRTTVASSHGPRSRQFSYYEASERFLMSRRIELVAEAVQLAIPGIPLHDVNPPIPNPNYYFLHVLTDVPRRLNVTSVHDAGISGAGVRISMVDTGIVTRVTERHVSVDRAHVIVDHTVRSVQGVWLATDAGHFGTNYFSGGVFDNNKITLGTALPDDSMNVEVVYSCLHPHYLAQGYKIDDIRSVANLDVDTDRYGHGTAEAANALAIAPKCTFSFVKAGDEGLEYPLAGFQAALQHQNPKIVTCSWETKTIDNALLLEIANAVANGITVIFAAGNGHTDDPTNPNAFKPVSHPNLISVGGAYPFETGTYAASNYSSSYDSFLYINPQRHCPDVVALVGEKPRGCLIMLPTGPNNFLDQDLSKEPFPNGDNTASDDGWCVCSGTSAAAPQTAGLAALLLERHPDLPPMAIKNILENSSRDIRTGSSATGDKAAPGWDRATGFGLLNGNRAIHYLIPDEFCPFIRDSVQDTGEAVTDRLFASPDIIVRNEQLKDPQGELGQTAKHIYDLSDEPEEARDNYIYLRVQNRGARRGDCTATVYYTAAGLFTHPHTWRKIGHFEMQDLTPGEFRVAGPIVWPHTDVCGKDYCLIATLNSAGSTTPDLRKIESSVDLINTVRSRDISWRNIDVVNTMPGSSSSWSFYIDGAGDPTDLQVDISGFPDHATVLIKIPNELANSVQLDQLLVVEKTNLYSTLRHLGGIATLRKLALSFGQRIRVSIYYSIPISTPAHSFSGVANLLIGRNKISAYTKIINVSTSAYVGNKRTLCMHKRGCSWLAKTSSYERLDIQDLNNARERGFKPCDTCFVSER